MNHGVWHGWAEAFLPHLLLLLFPPTICSSVSPTFVDYYESAPVPGTEDSDVSPTRAHLRELQPHGHRRTELIPTRNEMVRGCQGVALPQGLVSLVNPEPWDKN